MRKRQPRREKVGRGCGYLSLLQSLRAQVRVCRSFLCRLNLLLPIFCTAAFIVLSPSLAFFPTPSLSLCVSLNFLYPLLILSPTVCLILPCFNPPTWGQGSIICWPHPWLKTILCHLKHCQGTWNCWGKCHGTLSMTKAVSQSSFWIPAKHWWMIQHSPERFIEIVKKRKEKKRKGESV